MKHRGKLSIFFVGLGIWALVWLPDSLGLVLGPLFLLFFLMLWIVPIYQHSDGRPPLRTDPRAKGMANTVLGVGLGLLAALVFVFVPREWSWVLIGAAVVAIFVYLFRMRS